MQQPNHDLDNPSSLHRNSHWTDLILMSLNSSQERRIDDRSTAELLGQSVKAAFIISQLPPGSERSGFGIKSPDPFGLCFFLKFENFPPSVS